MNQPAQATQKKVRKVCDPGTVLGQIENSDSGPRIAVGDSDAVRARSPRLRVFDSETDSFDDQLDQPLEVPQQILELTDHLKRRRDQLAEKESQLKEQLSAWQMMIDQRQAATSDKERQLDSREKQMKSLQFHLLQIQNDVIDSQLSMERVIEHFENTDSDECLKRAIELLRFEVVERFEYVSKRWESLHSKLENLYSEPVPRKAA